MKGYITIFLGAVLLSAAGCMKNDMPTPQRTNTPCPEESTGNASGKKPQCQERTASTSLERP